METTTEYSQFVEHPRFGRGPNFTGLNPDPTQADVQLHWNTSTNKEIADRFESLTGMQWPFVGIPTYNRDTMRIANTAVVADVSRQIKACVPVTHYFDLKRKCLDCSRSFIFFAMEQKYWYEELGFGLDSDCIRCIDCRKKQRGIAQQRETYESLYHIEKRNDEQNLRLADVCLSLIESRTFTKQKTELVRKLLNRIPTESISRFDGSFDQIVERTISVEKRDQKQRIARDLRLARFLNRER